MTRPPIERGVATNRASVDSLTRRRQPPRDDVGRLRGVRLRRGHQLPKLGQVLGPLASTALPLGEPVFATCSSMSPLSCASPAAVATRCMETISPLTLDAKVSSSSRKYPMPPVMPAPTLRPTRPNTTTHPPVMYSQQWSPVPSTTVSASEFRTANLSPALPLKNAFPPVAP